MRCCAAILLLSVTLPAQILITPSKAVSAAAGSIVHFRSNVPVTWSLVPGSSGVIDSNGDYHAPNSIPVQDNLAGCELLPNDHVLNTRVDSLPVNPKSSEWMSRISVGHLNYSPSWGINIADNTTPSQSLHLLYTPEYDGKYQIPLWPNLKRESGVFSEPTSGADRHVVTINHQTCKVYELYNNYEPGVNTQCPTCTAQSGVSYSADTDSLPRVSTDAAGLFLAPLTLRLDEIQAGAIRHALRFTLRNNFISPSSVWPSTAHAGAWGFIPYGTRFRLRSDFDISRFSPVAKVLLTQLKEYGLMLADGGLDWDIQASTDVMEDYDVQMALSEIVSKGPRSNMFEAVDESSLMLSPTSGNINLQNRFVKPGFYALVLATQTSDPSKTAQVSVSLQGVTVGVPEPAIWIQSGVQTQLTAWVNGAANKSVQWTVSDRGGEITSSGVYAAPKVDHPTAVRITASSSADQRAKATITATIMPPGPIRIDVGNASNVAGTPNSHAPDYGPDSHGHMWWRDQAAESNGGAKVESGNSDTWPNKPDIALYYTARYAIGDMTYRFLVPNGNYKITLKIAHPGCKGSFDPKNLSPIYLEAQGQLIVRNFDFGEPIHHACLTPVDQFLPASVTDNVLTFSLRSGMTKDHLGNTLLNAFEIAADASPPHLTIAPATESLTTGEQRQFYAVRWFAEGDVKWSLTGPGSITPDGLYKSPATPGLKDQPVLIHARMATDTSITASEEFALKQGGLVLSPATGILVRGLSKQFKAIFGALAYTNLTWSVSPPIGVINQSGVFTAPDDLTHDTSVTVRAQSNDDASKFATAEIKLKAGIDPIRIRCGGGPGFTDAHGNYWSTDYNYSADTVANGSTSAISGTTPDILPLYQYSRYRYQDQPFNFHFVVPNGRYAVTLKFADYAHDEAGHYSFDVSLNGRKVLSNFDPDKANGAKVAVDKEFEVSVTNKQIRIDFLAHKDAAFINGIQIIYLGP